MSDRSARPGSIVRGRRHGRRWRSASAVLLVAILLVTSGGFVEAGADNVDPASTSLAPVAPSTPLGDDPASATTLVDGPTTTVDPDAPPVTSTAGGFGGPQVDPDAPPEPPMPDPSPAVRILLDQLLDQQHRDVIEQTDVLVADAEAVVDLYRNRELAVRRKLERSRNARALTDARIHAIEDDLRADALARYMNPGSTGIARMVDSGDASDRTRVVLAEVTTGIHTQQRADALTRRASWTAQIEKDVESLAGAKAATARARARADAVRRLTDAAVRQDLEDHEAVLRSNRVNVDSDWSLPIPGQSVFTAEELADWFVQRGFPSRAGAPIADLARYYIDEGNDQGIRGDMAFAQSVLETGSFTNRDTIFLNNFAGIGHCDTCANGFAFATPELGVRAQIQLLADYTERGVELAHPLVDRRLHGPSGCCQTWWQLTHTWATAGNYGPKIMGIYQEMLHWLVVRRGMVPRVGPR